MIYAIIAPPKPMVEISNKVDELGHTSFLYPIQAELPTLFLSYNKTSKELSDEIGLGGEDGIKPVIVLRVTDYYGYASRILWEWIQVNDV